MSTTWGTNWQNYRTGVPVKWPADIKKSSDNVLLRKGNCSCVETFQLKRKSHRRQRRYNELQITVKWINITSMQWGYWRISTKEAWLSITRVNSVTPSLASPFAGSQQDHDLALVSQFKRHCAVWIRDTWLQGLMLVQTVLLMDPPGFLICLLPLPSSSSKCPASTHCCTEAMIPFSQRHIIRGGKCLGHSKKRSYWHILQW